MGSRVDLGEWKKLGDYLLFGVFEITPTGAEPWISYESFERALEQLGVREVPGEILAGGVVGSVCGHLFPLSLYPGIPEGTVALPGELYRKIRNKQLTSDMDYWTFDEPFYGHVVIVHPQHYAGRIHTMKIPSLRMRALMEEYFRGKRDAVDS